MSHFKILYVHGLGSSSQSSTAQQLRCHFPKVLKDSFEFFSPDIPELPNEAIPFIELFVALNSIDLVIGSSLGGFKVLNCNFDYQVKRVVINPVVDFNATFLEISNSLLELYDQGVSIFNNNMLSHPTLKSAHLYAFLALNDEVLNNKLQLEALQNYYLYKFSTYKVVTLNGEGHKLSDLISEIVCPTIADMLYL